MNLRVRGPRGLATLPSVDPTTSTSEFRNLLESATGIPALRQEVLAGFPPRPLDLTSDVSITVLGIKAGDMLTVRESVQALREPAGEEQHTETASEVSTLHAMEAMDEDEALARAIAASLDEPAAASQAPPAQPRPAPAVSRPATRIHTLASASGRDSGEAHAAPPPGAEVMLPDGSCLVRRVIDADNSCLFNAVGYTMESGLRYKAPVLRQMIVEAVLADPGQWSAAVLEKDPVDYCAWIDDPHHWGGAIELSILSKRYGRQIAAFDIQTQRLDLYGSEHADYTERVLVLYDGLHYDALAVSPFPGAPEDMDATVFPVDGRRTREVMAAAGRLVAAAHDARQFTDTAAFTLRCGVCGAGLRGEREAVGHAKATGHADFSEY
ncbi:Ubiquitin thioesterase OTU1 [Auxenochlorella protothecoides]|uniref:Ubiquitin thioesterase OTU n=1 Tax=Auxenochlorella protothecoides TaxID=3075 RepID=A0A087SRY1_AUXPR|nr:Ubiquitin thioesterase OTU1 [Auxenochlorella protothecoides]KFM28485.1 Ubiquitin thioesterase OTU1 [Auxenochlorella protothecoides]RMZ55493.1 hypothetical protein APUTEX25_000076 [Auxenochlorella protothecoides]|eukprot:RMZ55493.1 hypothetical protein APUTEX25_000076 [Auxenochlorella protothecoides]